MEDKYHFAPGLGPELAIRKCIDTTWSALICSDYFLFIMRLNVCVFRLNKHCALLIVQVNDGEINIHITSYKSYQV